MHYIYAYWYLKNYQKSSKCLFHCLIICFIGWLLECFYTVYNTCVYRIMRKCYERRIDISVSLCLLNINSQSLRFMVVAVWEHCVYHSLHVQTVTTLWSLLQNFLAKKEINELHVHSSVNRNRVFTVKALIKSKKLARCKGTNDCSQILQQEIFERNLGLQGFVLNVKIILALWLTEWVRTIWSAAENKNCHFSAH